MSSWVREKLYPIIRAGMDVDNNTSVSLNEHDYNLLRQFSTRQSIEPIIWRGLKTTGGFDNCTDDLKKEFDRDKMRCVYYHTQRDVALKNIAAVFEEAEISYIYLKGAYLRDLYPEAWMRTSNDIDVLVPEDVIDNAVNVIEDKTDFIAGDKTFHHVSLVNKKIHIELHFSILEHSTNIDKLLGEVWKYALPEGNGYKYKLTPEYLLFHVLAHMSHHLAHGGIGMRPVLDLWLLRNRTDYDENIVRTMCETCSILKFYEVCCELSHVWMEDAPHNKMTEALEKVCLSGGAYGSEEIVIKTRQVGQKRSNYYKRRLFINKATLQRRYPILKDRPYLLPYYQARRWFKIFDKKRRSKIFDEIRVIKNTSQDEIDSLDKLLNDLGL